MNEKIVYSVEELCEMLSTNRQRIYVLIESGILKSLKLGKKYLVTSQNLQMFLEDYGDQDISNMDACIKSKIYVEEHKTRVLH